jgi:hypothetical protein
MSARSTVCTYTCEKKKKNRDAANQTTRLLGFGSLQPGPSGLDSFVYGPGTMELLADYPEDGEAAAPGQPVLQPDVLVRPVRSQLLRAAVA